MKSYGKKGKTIGLVLLMALCMLLYGCADAKSSENIAKESAKTTDFISEEPMMEEAVAEEYGAATDTGAGQSMGEEELGETVASNRKLIRRVSMSVETQEFNQLVQNIEKRVSELGGYMETSDIYGGSYQSSALKNADFTVRVPVDKLDEMVNAVSQNANVVSKNESATDVTLSYVDTQSRKEAYEIEYERLTVLLQQAEDIETIVALETRLTDVRYEIQSLESQLRTYDNLVDYATITISVSEVEIYTPTTAEPRSDLERMTEGFVASFQEIGVGLKNLAIDFVIALPYLIVWAIVICVIVCSIRLIIRRGKRKKEKAYNEKSVIEISEETAQKTGQE